jgi:hypothetical protein
MTKRGIDSYKPNSKFVKPNVNIKLCGIHFAVDTMGHVVQYLSPWFIVTNLFTVSKSFYEVLGTNDYGIWYNIWPHYKQKHPFCDEDDENIGLFVRFAQKNRDGFWSSNWTLESEL